MFSLLPRCHGECGSAKVIATPVAALTSAWSAISVPRSQVNDVRSATGNAASAAVSAVLVTLAVCAAGRCTSRVKPVLRSTSVAIADRLARPVIRSPSQCPIVWQSSASTGRSLIERRAPSAGTTRGLRPATV